MMAQLRIDFQGRGKVETFSWARIQSMGDGIQLTLRIGGQVRALGQVLTQQAIGILVGAPLPRGMRIGKADLDRESLGQLLVLGHLFAPIVGQRVPQRGGHLSELLGEASVGTGGIRAVHSGQQHQPCGPFHQGPDRRAIARAFQQVAFPVAGYRAGRHLGRAFSQRRHVGKLAPAIRSTRPRSPRFARLTQGCEQFGAQRPSREHIQASIDSFRRQLFAHIIRIRASQASGNLLGRVALPELALDVRPQPGITEFPEAPWLPSSRRRQCVRRASSIRSLPGVAGHLAADGAGISSQYPCHLPQRMAGGEAEAQGFTFFGTQVAVGSGSHSNTVAHQGW